MAKNPTKTIPPSTTDPNPFFAPLKAIVKEVEHVKDRYKDADPAAHYALNDVLDLLSGDPDARSTLYADRPSLPARSSTVVDRIEPGALYGHLLNELEHSARCVLNAIETSNDHPPMEWADRILEAAELLAALENLPEAVLARGEHNWGRRPAVVSIPKAWGNLPGALIVDLHDIELNHESNEEVSLASKVCEHLLKYLGQEATS